MAEVSSPTAIAFWVDLQAVVVASVAFSLNAAVYEVVAYFARLATDPLPSATVSIRFAFAPLPIAAEFSASVSVTPPNAARELEAFAIVL